MFETRFCFESGGARSVSLKCGGGVNVIQNFDLIVVFIFNPPERYNCCVRMNFYDSGKTGKTTFFFPAGGPLEPSTARTIIKTCEFILSPVSRIPALIYF